MNDQIQQLQTFFAHLGVPSALVPVLPVLLIVAVFYAVALPIGQSLVRLRRLSPRTASFYLLISPWIIGFITFTLGPMLYSFYLSLTSWDLIDPPQWVGLSNYTSAFQDSAFYTALKVTFYYALVGVPLNIALSLLVALLMNNKVPGINVFRTIYYLPSLVTGVAQIVLFIRVFNPQYGIVNSVLAKAGLPQPGWLQDPKWAMPAIIAMGLWTVGGNMVIYLAGLQDVPVSLHEAAAIDGAGWFSRFWHVTFPQMSPVLFFNLITGLIGALQIFTQGYVLRSGPDDSLLFYVYYLYQNAFQYFQMGYGSALAWILFVIILVLTGLVFRTSALWVYYETEQYGIGTQRKSRRRWRPWRHRQEARIG